MATRLGLVVVTSPAPVNRSHPSGNQTVVMAATNRSFNHGHSTFLVTSTTTPPGENGGSSTMNVWLAALLGVGLTLVILIMILVGLRQCCMSIQESYELRGRPSGKCKFFWSFVWCKQLCVRSREQPNLRENRDSVVTLQYESPPPYPEALGFPRLDSSTIMGEPPPRYSDPCANPHEQATSMRGYLNLSFDRQSGESSAYAEVTFDPGGPGNTFRAQPRSSVSNPSVPSLTTRASTTSLPSYDQAVILLKARSRVHVDGDHVISRSPETDAEEEQEQSSTEETRTENSQQNIPDDVSDTNATTRL